MDLSVRKLPENAKCKRCRAQATIRLPQHHTHYCQDCYLTYFEKAVTRAMRKYGITHEQPLMVAVSGGKDSLALWSVLYELGYTTRGLHIDLGIGDFSERSLAAVTAFAEPRGLAWSRYGIRDIFPYDLEEIRRKSRRKICSVCGLLKRHLLNRLTLDEGFQIIATGHNLDDEAGRLLGNLVRHRDTYLDKLSPFLPSSHHRLPAKFKPLYRLEASEILTYCDIKGIVPAEGKCPYSRGATSHTFQHALNYLEKEMPGTKRDFLFTYLKKRGKIKESDFSTCKGCGEASYGDQCAVCRLLENLTPEVAP